MKQASLVSLALCLIGMAQAGEKSACAPSTWKFGEFSDFPNASDTMVVSDRPVRKMLGITGARDDLKAGDINCRYTADTYDMVVDSNTCARLAKKYMIRLETFFVLNPTVNPSCDNLKPDTEYCVKGFIEPLRAYDGKCGPPNGGATCVGTGLQCCNSETWTCGNSEEDCAKGICYEGSCFGDSIYTTNGECGSQHGYKLCAGKWGDCCNKDGKCGTGEAFCSAENCQLDDCAPQPGSMIGGLTEDGTCGAKYNERKCREPFGKCCGKDGWCGKSAEACGNGCQPLFGTFSSSSTTSLTNTATAPN